MEYKGKREIDKNKKKKMYNVHGGDTKKGEHVSCNSHCNHI